MVRNHQLTWATLIITALVVLIAAYIDVFVQNRVKSKTPPQKTQIQTQSDNQHHQHASDTHQNTEIIKSIGMQHHHTNKPRFDIQSLPSELQDYLDQRQAKEFKLEKTAKGFRLEANGQWEVVTMAIVEEDGSITLVERQVQPQRPINLPAPSS